jgi:hypothetical protein
VDRVYSIAPPIPFVGEKFAGSHLLGRPDENAARKKAAQLLKNMRGLDPRHLYRVSSIALDFKKVGKAEWWYGKAELQRFPLARDLRFICAPSTGSSLLTSNSSKTSGVFNVASAEFNALQGLLCCLNMERRMALFLAPTTAECGFRDYLFECPLSRLTKRARAKAEARGITGTLSWREVICLTIRDELTAEFTLSSKADGVLWHRKPKMLAFLNQIEEHRSILIAGASSLRQKVAETKLKKGMRVDLTESQETIILLVAILEAFKKDNISFFSTNSEVKKEFKAVLHRMSTALLETLSKEALKFVRTLARTKVTQWKFHPYQATLSIEFPLRAVATKFGGREESYQKYQTRTWDSTDEQWEIQSQVKECMGCQQPFKTLTKRKKRCRNCGKVLCKACLSKTFRLMDFGSLDPVRVCDECHLSLSGVEWQNYEQTTACSKCSKKFSVLKRKQYCRNCGNLFCKKCSSRRLYLPKSGTNDPVAVCNDCYEQITSVKLADDQNAKQCKACSKTFRFLGRTRHYCHNCGEIFCGRCTSKAAYMSHSALRDHVQVCEECFVSLTARGENKYRKLNAAELATLEAENVKENETENENENENNTENRNEEDEDYNWTKQKDKQKLEEEETTQPEKNFSGKWGVSKPLLRTSSSGLLRSFQSRQLATSTSTSTSSSSSDSMTTTENTASPTDLPPGDTNQTSANSNDALPQSPQLSHTHRERATTSWTSSSTSSSAGPQSPTNFRRLSINASRHRSSSSGRSFLGRPRTPTEATRENDQQTTDTSSEEPRKEENESNNN